MLKDSETSSCKGVRRKLYLIFPASVLEQGRKKEVRNAVSSMNRVFHNVQNK